jgi:AcrR family transcriptional regulator
MPPKAKISTEAVLDGAFELVRQEGMDVLTARRLAQELGCSTQPVYRAFASMDALRAAVMERAEAVALAFLMPPDAGDQGFLQMGFGSLKFAQEEPHLYRLVTLEGEALKDLQQGKTPPEFVLAQMRTEATLASLSDEQLARIHALMWFFSQGLSSLFFSETEEDPMARAQEYLMLAGRAVIGFEMNST